MAKLFLKDDAANTPYSRESCIVFLANCSSKRIKATASHFPLRNNPSRLEQQPVNFPRKSEMHLLSPSPVPSHGRSDGPGLGLCFITHCSLCCAWRLWLFPSWIWTSLPAGGAGEQEQGHAGVSGIEGLCAGRTMGLLQAELLTFNSSLPVTPYGIASWKILVESQEQRKDVRLLLKGTCSQGRGSPLVARVGGSARGT